VAQVGAAIGREFSHTLLAAVARKPEIELRSSLDRLVGAGLLFRQGVPPHAAYMFKHALVQDAAYGTLLREPRRALHARIAESIEIHSTEIAENQPEILARHCIEAGLIEKAAGLLGKAGQRSLERSALVEAVAQLTSALDQSANLPATPELRRKQIKVQVSLANALMHLKGYAAPETKAAAEHARLLIEQAEALGEPSEEPLLMFSVLYAFWVANSVAFNGEKARELAAEFLALAAKQTTTAPLLIGHRVMAHSLMHTGSIAEGRLHYDQAFTLYDPAEHYQLATRFGQDAGVSILSNRSLALWLLGWPEAALVDVERALENARATGYIATLAYGLWFTSFTFICCAKYSIANTLIDELHLLADERGALLWKALATATKGCLFALTGKSSDAVRTITSGITALRSTGSTIYVPLCLSNLTTAYANLRQFDEAWRSMDEATAMIEATGERWFEAEANRIAGEIALQSPEANAEKAKSYFERALAVARQQQAKSWELRAATSLARLWRDQGKSQQARELLAPVYGWFTEGFDTRDLKEAKALLTELA
jgi:predicted ATPase